MPRPTSATTIARPDLGVLAYEYLAEASRAGFIGLSILPIFETPEKSAEYPVIPLEAVVKLKDTKRSPRGGYNRSDYEFENKTYACKENGWEEPLDDVERKLYARLFDAEEVATERAMDIVLRNQEKRIADLVFNTANIANTANVSTEWSTAATCTPRLDVLTAKEAMRKASGLVADKMAMSITVFNNLLLCKEICDALQYTNPFQMGGLEAQKQALAMYFGVSEILVGGAIRDQAKKGQSFSIADIWDDEYVLLYKSARNPQDLKEPSLGRTFLWTADSPSNAVVESYRDETVRSDIYRVRHYTDECLSFAGAGYLLGNITA